MQKQQNSRRHAALQARILKLQTRIKQIQLQRDALEARLSLAEQTLRTWDTPEKEPL